MDGQARTLGAHVDIGADESDGTIWPHGPYVIVRVSPDRQRCQRRLVLGRWPSGRSRPAIDAAAAVGGEVWVAAGTYPERITLRAYVAPLRRVCRHRDAAVGQRNWSANPTILDGNQAGSVVTATGG